MDLDAADRLAYWMDRAFRLPGTNFRFGLDGLLGIIPGMDVVGALVSFYVVFVAYNHGVPSNVLWQMIGNIVIDMIVGSVFIVGDIFDFFFKANSRNVELLKKYMRK